MANNRNCDKRLCEVRRKFSSWEIGPLSVIAGRGLSARKQRKHPLPGKKMKSKSKQIKALRNKLNQVTKGKKHKPKTKLINGMSKRVGGDDSWKPEARDIPQAKFKVINPGKGKKKVGKKKEARQRVSKLDNKDFYHSREWRELRTRVLEKYGCACLMCGRTYREHKVIIHVDHIKPRSKYPELSLDYNNLQILCEDCNLGKSNKYQTDYRVDK
jgi:hypothetical protein